MAGPLRKQTENKILLAPVVENNPGLRLRPPARTIFTSPTSTNSSGTQTISGTIASPTENKILLPPVVENNPGLRLRPPASNAADPIPADGKKNDDDGLFVRNGGFERG